MTTETRPRRYTQHNSLPACGIEPRTFLSLLREFKKAGFEVLSVGRLRSVDAEHFDEWLRSRKVASVEPANDGADPVVSGLAAELGLVSVGGAR